MELVKQVDYRQQAWMEYIQNQNVLHGIQQSVLLSWKRCWGRLNPYNENPPDQLNSELLLASQVRSFDLLTIARPIMEDIYQFIEHTDSVIIFMNSAGYVLDNCSDPGMLEFVRSLGISAGALFSEAECGSNAFGIALIDRIPNRVIGAEHFLLRYHGLAESAAPIFDTGGRLLGVLGIITPADRHHAHTLGLVVTGAKAIETQYRSDQLLVEQNQQLSQLKTILAVASEGILVWNADRILMHINPSASQIFGIPETKLLGRRIGDYVDYPLFLRDAVDHLRPLTDVETTLNIDGRMVSCFVSLRYVVANNRIQWIIMSARREKEMQQLVQKQVGASATLTIEELLGDSLPMKRVRRFIKKVSPAKACILIRGETGTGKAHVASAIHNASPRRDHPFISYACPLVPNEIAVRELLGFDEGLPDEMTGGRSSKFELASGGTMYFRDVEYLSLEAQAILLNVIDLGIVQRVGSQRPIEVDVRVIACTNANIEELVTRGNFRGNLYSRLGSFEVRLPPLRERLEDLTGLFDRILSRLAIQFGHTIELSQATIKILRKYPWPGNIRELETVLRNAAIQAGKSGTILPDHIPSYIHNEIKVIASSTGKSSIEPIREVERDLILKAAEECRGNVSAMARLLGIGRTTVWRKVNRLGLSMQEFRPSSKT